MRTSEHDGMSCLLAVFNTAMFCVGLLSCAHRYTAPDLKKICLNFIIKHFHKVQESPGFESLSQVHTHTRIRTNAALCLYTAVVLSHIYSCYYIGTTTSPGGDARVYATSIAMRLSPPSILPIGM